MAADKLIKIRPVTEATSTAESGNSFLAKAVMTIDGLTDGYGVAVKDEVIYVSDPSLHVIFKKPKGGTSSIFVGSSGQDGFADGQGEDALFDTPSAICLDASGNLYVVDKGNNKIRRVTENGNVYTVASITGETPTGIFVDASGNIYLLDTTA
jgi:sugar lactone lactonase YvrE